MSAIHAFFAALSVIALLCVAGIPLALQYLRRRTGFGFSWSDDTKIVASDVGVRPTLLLRDKRTGICGRPDYILEATTDGRRTLAPLEVKPCRRGWRLYDADRIQIGAYLLALRATFGSRASRLGYVRYHSRTFEVVLASELEVAIERLAGELRRARTASTIHRSHQIPARCLACPVRRHCDERMPQ